VRISTAETRRAIDKWKERTSSEVSRFHMTTAAVITSFLSNSRGIRAIFALALIALTILNFAFSEFALLTLLTFLTAKLYCYKLVNSFFRFVPFVR